VNMATVRVIQKLNKLNKSGEAPLYLRVTKDRKAKFISLGYTLDPKDWNPRQCMVRKSFPEHERMNNFIVQKIAEAKGTSAELETNSKYVPSKTIKQAILGKATMSFFEFADKYILNFERNNKILTYNKKKGHLNKLKKYVGNTELTFDDINVHFLKNYEDYLRNTIGNATNSIHTDLKNIRAIINQAILEDIIPLEKNAFLKYKLKLESTEKEYLTEEELKVMEDLIIPESQVRFNHRNIYVFSAYAGGLRISDIFRLKWENFDGERIILNTQKATTTVSLKLPNKALEILNIYKKSDNKPSDYIFPFLKNDIDYSDLKHYYRVTSSLTAATNKDLKTIAKMSSINKNIHFHTSRHTWATRALKKGMRIEYVSKLMGHQNIRTTQVYAKIVNEELDKAMDVFNS